MEDLAYVDKLVRPNPRYTKFVAKKEYEMWIGNWEAVNEPDNIYIKIDDDVVSPTNSSPPVTYSVYIKPCNWSRQLMCL